MRGFVSSPCRSTAAGRDPGERGSPGKATARKKAGLVSGCGISSLRVWRVHGTQSVRVARDSALDDGTRPSSSGTSGSVFESIIHLFTLPY